MFGLIVLRVVWGPLKDLMNSAVGSDYDSHIVLMRLLEKFSLELEPMKTRLKESISDNL